MRVRDCEKCTHYKRYHFYHIHPFGFCRLANKKCMKVKKLECDDLKLTAEMNEILKRVCKITREDIENAKEVGDLINKKIEDRYDKARAADTSKPGQTDPS